MHCPSVLYATSELLPAAAETLPAPVLKPVIHLFDKSRHVQRGVEEVMNSVHRLTRP